MAQVESDEMAPPVDRHRVVLGLVVSVIALVGVAWWASKQQAPELPDDVGGYGLVGMSILLYGIATAGRGWRWHVILRHADVPHDVRDAYGLTVVGYMGNAVLPARGGEVLRILLLNQRSGARRREVLGAVLPERILDAAALGALFAVLASAGVGGERVHPAWGYGAGLALALGLAGLFVYNRLRVAGYFESFAERVRPVAKASRLMITPWGLGLFGLSVGVWMCEAVIFFCVAEALDVSLSIVEGLVVVVLGSFLALVPAGPGYVGTYDAGLLFALGAFGVKGGAALGSVLLFRFVVFVPITLLGLVLIFTRYGGPAALRRARAAET